LFFKEPTMMNKISLAALLSLALAGPLLGAAVSNKPLPAPQNLTVTVEEGSLEFSWQAVTGAACYRLAVFLDKDKNGSPLAAVWIKGTRYLYGQDPFILKIGGLPSKAPASLQKGSYYRWIVAAAAPGGLRKSDWAGSRFEYSQARPKPTASITPTPMGGGLTVSPENETSTAKTEEPTATATQTPEPENVLKEASSNEDPSMEKAQQLLKERKWEPAQKEFKRLCDQDANNFDAWAGLGDSYLGANLRVEAVDAYRKALALKDDQRIGEWMKKNVRPR
jgi:tetratricopeptide (TPR) repeat protein